MKIKMQGHQRHVTIVTGKEADKIKPRILPRKRSFRNSGYKSQARGRFGVRPAPVYNPLSNFFARLMPLFFNHNPKGGAK